MIDLKFNYPSIPEEASLLQDLWTEMDITEALRFPPYQGHPKLIGAARRYFDLERSSSNDIVICNSGNHSLTSVLTALRLSHDSVITEPFLYAAFKAIARNLQFRLFPASFDSQGITPEGIEENYSKTKAKLIYIQPTIHNPTCAVMPLERRRRIADFCKKNGIIIIEDDVYIFES